MTFTRMFLIQLAAASCKGSSLEPVMETRFCRRTQTIASVSGNRRQNNLEKKRKKDENLKAGLDHEKSGADRTK